MRSEAGLQGFPVDHVNGTLKQARDVILDARIVEHRRDNRGVEVNENVDVAIGSLLVTGNGTEQGGMRDAVRPQVGLAFPQRLYDLVAFHTAFYTTKAVGFRRPNQAAIMEQIFETGKPHKIKARRVFHMS